MFAVYIFHIRVSLHLAEDPAAVPSPTLYIRLTTMLATRMLPGFIAGRPVALSVMSRKKTVRGEVGESLKRSSIAFLPPHGSNQDSKYSDFLVRNK